MEGVTDLEWRDGVTDSAFDDVAFTGDWDLELGWLLFDFE